MYLMDVEVNLCAESFVVAQDLKPNHLVKTYCYVNMLLLRTFKKRNRVLNKIFTL